MLNNYQNMSANFAHWPVTLAFLGLLSSLTKHHALHKPEHVGMFAGSLLQREDWDH